MLQFRTSEKAQTHKIYAAKNLKLFQKEKVHAKQSGDKKSNLFPK